jgi:hypothetical protein
MNLCTQATQPAHEIHATQPTHEPHTINLTNLLNLLNMYICIRVHICCIRVVHIYYYYYYLVSGRVQASLKTKKREQRFSKVSTLVYLRYHVTISFMLLPGQVRLVCPIIVSICPKKQIPKVRILWHHMVNTLTFFCKWIFARPSAPSSPHLFSPWAALSLPPPLPPNLTQHLRLLP